MSSKAPVQEQISPRTHAAVMALKVLLPQHSDDRLRQLLKESGGDADTVLESLLAGIDDVVAAPAAPAVLVAAPPAEVRPAAPTPVVVAPVTVDTTPAAPAIDESSVRTITDMGFDPASARAALVATDGDGDAALELLLSGGDLPADAAAASSSSSALPAAAAAASSSSSDLPAAAAEAPASPLSEEQLPPQDAAPSMSGWTVIQEEVVSEESKFVANVEAPSWQPLLRTGGKDSSSTKRTHYDVQTERLKAALSAPAKRDAVIATTHDPHTGDMHGGEKGKGKGDGKGKERRGGG